MNLTCLLRGHKPIVNPVWSMKGAPYPKGGTLPKSSVDIHVICDRCGILLTGRVMEIPPEPFTVSPIQWWKADIYIEAIEEAIRDNVRNHGRVPNLPEGRERIGDQADILAVKLTDLANQLAVDLGMGGDPNITYMHCLSMITFAWTYFILEAKSRASQRYPPDALRYMRMLVESAPDLYETILIQAKLYGDSYPVDNPKWAAAVAEWEERCRTAAVEAASKIPLIKEAK